MEPNRKDFFNTRFIRFLGGKNLLFGLITIILIGIALFLYQRVGFIFTPIIVFFHTVILPVILSVIAFYLLRPVLKLLMKWKVPKIWGIVLLYFIVIGLITLLVTLVVPFLKDQFMNLFSEFPQYFMQLVNNIQHFVEDSRFTSTLDKYDIDLNEAITQIGNDLVNTVKDVAGNLGTGLASSITGFVSTLTGIVLAIVTVPFILFYLLKDGEKLPKAFLKLVPPAARKDTQHILKDADHQISSYIQGQLIVSFCIGVMVTIGFLIIGLDYAIPLGFLAMITSVVPYLGPIIAITPAAIIAIVTAPFMILKLAIVWTVVQLIEGKFISPQVMGKSLHVHPITIIFVLLTAGSLFGVPGVVLGIPGYAVLKVLVSHLWNILKQRFNKFQPEEHKYEVKEWKDEEDSDDTPNEK
ncbi:MAG: AI-2E family transporter [Kurthia sp.]|nr:AI-2E family transporter [Candidatus Kurthia equi]